MRIEGGITMPQDQVSGARAVEYGLQAARKIAQKLDGIKIGKERSNEYEVDGRKIVIKCARLNTKSVGVPYQLLDRVDAILGSFENENSSYDLYEMTPDIYRKSMKPTHSTGPSSGRVGMVRKSIFIDQGKFLERINLD